MDENKLEFKLLIAELLKIQLSDRDDEIIERLDIISPDPEFTDYIYHSDQFHRDDGSFDIEALTEKVFSYKPICL